MRLFIFLFACFYFLNTPIFSQTLAEIVAEVSSERVVQNIHEFSGETPTMINNTAVVIQHRVSNQGNDLAAEFLKERLTLPNIIVNDIVYDEKGRNIVGVQIGTVTPDKIIMICGHYDSVANYCADDNASGTIAVVEAANILSKYNFKNTLVYALWDEEEVGLKGARDYATKAKQNGDDIIAVLNMDMMAYDGNNDHFFDIDVRDIANSYEIRDDLIELVETFDLDLNYHVVDPGTSASDHSAFWDQGYSAVLLGEAWSDNDVTPAYHTSGDRWSLLSEDYYIEMIKLAVVYAASKGDLVSSAIASIPENKIKVNPNPVSTEFLISGYEKKADNYLIFDSIGRTVKKDSLNISETMINISDLIPATYFIQLKKGGKAISQKEIIKQ